MKRGFKRKVLLLVLTVIIINMTNVCFVPDKVYAKKPEKDSKNISQSSDITAKYYIVSQDGLGDFTSIQEAVNFAKDGDTLIIYPGIYTENIEVTDKVLHIIGVDRDSCILQYDTISYFKVPLTIAAGSVSNLTIYGIHLKDSSAEEISLTDENIGFPEILSEDMILSADGAVSEEVQGLKEIREHQKNHTGYAVHIDDNFLYEKELKFRNCKIISENNHCIGIGSRGKSNLSFEKCDIISAGNGGCIYLHDCILPEYQGDVTFSMKNCQLTSYLNPYVMTVESLGGYNPTYMTFQNVRVSAVAFEEVECYVSNNVNTSFNIDTLMFLDKNDQLESNGLTSTVMHRMVHELTLEESNQYIESINALFEQKNPSIDYDILSEGITYIKSQLKTSQNFEMNQNELKKTVLNFQNVSGQSGSGWYGLENVYLTPDSCGNTLIEMNSIFPLAF